MNSQKPCAKLLKVVRYWRTALRLDDWQIALQPAAAGELEKEQCYAYATVAPYQRHITIFLPTLAECGTNAERALVHELLHVVFAQYSLWGSQQEVAGQLAMEQALNATGDALVRLRAGGNGKE